MVEVRPPTAVDHAMPYPHYGSCHGMVFIYLKKASKRPVKNLFFLVAIKNGVSF